jgi:LmbE family N-acetylglucosaminyl deacetylase
MAAKRVLLGVFAHPDDESFGPGATLARYAAEGADVHIVIATDGIAGSVEDPKFLQQQESLAQIRSAELARAVVALGATSVWSLPYEDSGMRGTPENNNPAALIQQPVEKVTLELLGYIRRLRPTVILTHDPYGGYGHPDHIRCCEAVTAAFHIARGEASQQQNGYAGPQKLYYTAFDQRILQLALAGFWLARKDATQFGRNKDINLVEIASWPKPVNATIHVGAYLQKKDLASRARRPAAKWKTISLPGSEQAPEAAYGDFGPALCRRCRRDAQGSPLRRHPLGDQPRRRRHWLDLQRLRAAGDAQPA